MLEGHWKTHVYLVKLKETEVEQDFPEEHGHSVHATCHDAWTRNKKMWNKNLEA